MKKLSKLSVPALAIGFAFGSVGLTVHAETTQNDHMDNHNETVHTVSPGSTLYSIAQLHKDVTLKDLYAWNPDVDPFNLTVGSQIRVQPPNEDSREIFHTVSPGSTLYSIAQLHKDVTLEDLYAWNPDVDPFNLTVGSQIRVQPPNEDSREVFHTVTPGSTLYSIAQLHKDVTLEDLYEWNPSIDPFHLPIGSQVRVKE